MFDIINIRRDGEQGTLGGTVRLFGTLFHLTAVEVLENDRGEQVPVRDDYQFLKAMREYDNIRFQTVSLPGFDGQYAVFITPYEE